MNEKRGQSSNIRNDMCGVQIELKRSKKVEGVHEANVNFALEKQK